MSGGQLARNRALSMGSGRESQGRNAELSDFNMPHSNISNGGLEPCDATASMLLYAQGASVVVAHHDTLKIERRFTRHTEEIKILAVDNVSERGSGRLVITYDAGQTAIVWDLMTGDEVSRFASYNDLSVAAWMRNGNVAFGNSQGNVILFEPSTSEHISARTIDQIPITAIAPAADCRTYAIGYANGSLLVAALQPRFTILHSLTTSRAPSPIVTLAWHASSSRQKSDMLASQTYDGDVRVWSVAKSPHSSDPAKIVRVLKKSENSTPGANWLGWSKNGRIIQYSDGETLSWDVRTKNVTYESVPTLEGIRGVALYGPGATLFTLGRNNTAQQFDLNSPPVLVANVQHPANLLPPSPPISIEEQKAGITAVNPNDYSSVPINIELVSESEDEHMSPLARITRDVIHEEDPRDARDVPDRSGALSPVSSQASYTSRSSAGSRAYRRHGAGSVTSKGMSDHTMMSMGSSLHSRQPSVISSRDSISMSSMSSASQTSNRSRPRTSRLRQEVLRSPEEKIVVDLFKFTKSRLSDIPYSQPQVPNGRNLTNDDLRRQMLSTIFGWKGEPEDLIRDELSRYPRGSPNSLLLTKWLGDLDTDIMASSSESMTSSDWMLLALSGIGGQASQQKVARAYVQRLLEKGDVHTAATIMIGMGDQNDAIEIYVSHKRYMEALILTCYQYPADWGRQCELIRKWGEWAVQHSQQQLAIRCFSCTSVESSEQWFSPSAQQLTFPSIGVSSPTSPQLASPPLSPPMIASRGPQRNMAKTAALKLVTSFGNQQGKAKFFGADGDRTPMNGIAATPIAESALSPGGNGGSQTAFLRPSNRSTLNTPASATRTATPGGYARARLPSIGEMPTDVTPILEAARARARKMDDDTSSEVSVSTNGRSKRSHTRETSVPETLQLGSATYNPISRATTASPMMQKSKQANPLPNPLPSPNPAMFNMLQLDLRTRNGSRDRKPKDLQIQWPPMESIITGDYMTTPDLASSKTRPRTARSVTSSVAGSVSSMTSGKSYRSRRAQEEVASPVTGRSIDQYISSLDAARYEQPKQRARAASRDPNDRSGRGRSSSRKPKAREPSEDRGRSGMRYPQSGKRSPRSPVPMSPEEFRDMGALTYDDDQSETQSSYSYSRRVKHRDESQATAKPGSKAASRIRRMSPEALQISTRAASRRTSPEPSLGGRGRSKARDGSAIRSPSSPLPMSPQAAFYTQTNEEDGEEEKDLQAAKADQERFRSRHRSGSRVRERGTSSVRHVSPERKSRARSSSRRGGAREPSATREREEPRKRAASLMRTTSDFKAGDLSQIKTDRQRKKELAAKELEERRRSLVRRPSAPPIVYPEQLSPAVFRPSSRSGAETVRSDSYTSPAIPPRSVTVSPESMRLASSRFQEPSRHTSIQIGLPATPRAMQHPKYDPDNKSIPEVPQIPENYNSSQSVVGSPVSIVHETDLDTLGPLPQTTFSPLPKSTYQASPRHIPPRSMSAPIPEEPLSPKALPAGLPTHPAFQAALAPSTRLRNQEQYVPVRKITPGDATPGTLGYESRNIVLPDPSAMMGGIDETLMTRPINPANNNMMPPPPPPAPCPPILRELQHLAYPPPPPPAPLHRMGSSSSVPTQSTGMIEIIMDDEEEKPRRITPPASTKRLTPPAMTHPTMQPFFPPTTTQLEARAHSVNHQRGHSITDNSISGRLSRATERMRSASRGANPQLNRTRSPPISPPLLPDNGHSPYESLPVQRWVMDQMNRAPPSAYAPHPGGMDGGMI